MGMVPPPPKVLDPVEGWKWYREYQRKNTNYFIFAGIVCSLGAIGLFVLATLVVVL